MIEHLKHAKIFEHSARVKKVEVKRAVQFCSTKIRSFIGLYQMDGSKVTQRFIHRPKKKKRCSFFLGGDIQGGRGNGGESIYGETFADETFVVKHDQRGVLGSSSFPYCLFFFQSKSLVFFAQVWLIKVIDIRMAVSSTSHYPTLANG